MINETDNLERRIGRRMDGLLDEAQTAELQRELMRDPEARAMAEAMASADAAAGEALRAAFGHGAAVADGRWARSAARCEAGNAVRGRAWRWAAVAAAAAAVVIGTGVWFAVTQRPGTVGDPAISSSIGGGSPATRPDETLPTGLEHVAWAVWGPPGAADESGVEKPAAMGDAPAAASEMEGPRSRRRTVDRSIFSVYDEQEKAVYLLGVDRVKTTVHAVASDL